MSATQTIKIGNSGSLNGACNFNGVSANTYIDMNGTVHLFIAPEADREAVLAACDAQGIEYNDASIH